MRASAKVKDLIEMTKLTRNQVNYALTKLLDVQLAIRADGGYVGIAETDDQIARVMGTYGKGERRREGHRVERALRAGRYIERWRVKHDPKNYSVLKQNEPRMDAGRGA